MHMSLAQYSRLVLCLQGPCQTPHTDTSPSELGLRRHPGSSEVPSAWVAKAQQTHGVGHDSGGGGQERM